MAKSFLARRNEFSGELLHFGIVRMRVTGTGILKLFLRSLDDVHNSTLPTTTLLATTNKEMTTLSNYVDQYGQLELKTTTIYDRFNISNIKIYIKPVASGLPQ